MRPLLLVACLCLASMTVAQVTATRSNPPTIVVDPQASPQERLAARELAQWLGRILSVQLTPLEVADAPVDSILVGDGAAARQHFPDVRAASLRNEEVVVRAGKGRLLVVGGGQRGTLYAVNRLLHRLGVRWWTPWATHVPTASRVPLGFSMRERPAFESRDPFWFHAFDRDWARRNGSNSMHARLTDEDGGKIVYQGFVHTFFSLVPPDKYFKEHPEYFSLIDGKRKWEGAQICTTNPEVREIVVAGVLQWLQQNPKANIVSVSQNDWYGACQCPTCKALDDAEGSHAATVLDLANYVGERIEKLHPGVSIDTLAYQYTRKAPKTMRPRHNVIVRLCSIECNFAQPLTHASNEAFARDLRDWSRLTNRLYVWNYVTDFPNYMMPFPNWYVIGPNQRFYHQNGVKGLFEQGAYQSYGSAMAEMHAWVQAQLLWNPYQDDRKLIREFLEGYYGAAAKPIQRYLDLLAERAAPHVMTIWTGPDAPFFDAATVLESERLWQEAERLVKGDDDLLWRVRLGHLPIRYVLLSRWTGLRREAKQQGLSWPLPESRKAVADGWIAFAKAPGPTGWAPITHMNESGLKPERWIERFAEDPAIDLPGRSASPPLPKGLDAGSAKVIDLQDEVAKLYGEGSLCELRPDKEASDGVACRMPGTHREWAFQMPMSKAPKEVLEGKWRAYVVVRVELAAQADAKALAFTAGVYSADLNRGLGGVERTVEQMGSGYQLVPLSTVELTSGCYVWVAPPANDSVKAIWVDRVLLVKVTE